MTGDGWRGKAGAMNREWWRQLAEEQPRTYGAALIALGVAVLAFMYAMATRVGRVSLLLVVVAPGLVVFGTQALVLGTRPSSLREDPLTSTVLAVVSCVGGWLAYRWIVG